MSNTEVQYPDTPFPLQPSLVLLGRRGSEAHGTHLPPEDPNGIDDRDLMGVCIPPPAWTIGMRHWEGAEAIKGVWDVVLYDFRKFVRLLTKQNPNVLGLLWLEPEDYLHVAPAGRALIAARDIFRARHPAYAAFVGYACSQLQKMQAGTFAGYMGEKRKRLVERHGYDCYVDEETEFLTEVGWRRFDDVSGARLGTASPASGALEWQHAVAFTDKVHDGPVYVVEPYSTRAVVTPGHNMLVSPAHRSRANGYSTAFDPTRAEWQLVPLRQLLDGHRSHFHIRRAPAPRAAEHGVDDDYLQLAAFYIAEGSTNFRDGNVKSIRFTQSKPGPFFELADRIAARYGGRRYDYARETVWVFHGPTARQIHDEFGHGSQKRLPAWCLNLSARQADVLWKALMLGDGTTKDANDTYYCSLHTLAGDIQAAMVAAGHPCVTYGPFVSTTSYGPVSMHHVVRSLKSGSIHALALHRVLGEGQDADDREGHPIKEVDGRGKRVVCFEVPNGTLITRSRGRVAIHGNCKNAAHLVRLLHMGHEYLITGALHVRRTWDREMLLDIKRGRWSLDAVKRYAERRLSVMSDARAVSVLPERVDEEAVNALVIDCLRQELAA